MFTDVMAHQNISEDGGSGGTLHQYIFKILATALQFDWSMGAFSSQPKIKLATCKSTIQTVPVDTYSAGP